MNHGVLQCCGSSVFLKSRFGAGYSLNLVKSPQGKVTEIQDFVQSN